jgi:phenylalanine-4-hydroxylase
MTSARRHHDDQEDFAMTVDIARFLIPQAHDTYTAQDHDVWCRLAVRQRDLLKGRASAGFLQGLDRLAIGDRGVPDFAALNARLQHLTGWEVVAVPGLVPDLAFFALLADRKFPAGRFIRRPDQFDYIEEPDIFHDVFGHVPLLSSPAYADYLEAYGRAGLVAEKTGALPYLARLYWYSVEFSLAHTPDGLRITGAGIVSSPGETVFALESPIPQRLDFDLTRVMRTRYRIDDFQQTYFVMENEEAWPSLDMDELRRIWTVLAGLPDLEPGPARADRDVAGMVPA